MHKLIIKHNFHRVLDFNVYCGKKQQKMLTKSKSEYYYHDGQTLMLIKNNPWEAYDQGTKIFMWLFTMDIVFGNVFDCENLPFSIDLCVNGDKEVDLCEIAISDSCSIERWIRAAKKQMFLVSMLIFIIGMLVAVAAKTISFMILTAIGVLVFIKNFIKLIKAADRELRTYVK